MRSHVPAFGSWDCNNDLPFTQCFDSARPEGLLHYAYSGDRDLYDTPAAMILVSRPALLVTTPYFFNQLLLALFLMIYIYIYMNPYNYFQGKSRYDPPNREKQVKKRDAWVMCDCECDLKSRGSSPGPAPKAVDEDLYKISPHLLRQHAKKVPFFSVLGSSSTHSTLPFVLHLLVFGLIFIYFVS